MNNKGINDLIQRVWSLGCNLRIESEQLKLAGNTKRIEADLLAQIKNYKSEIICCLKNSSERLELSNERPEELPMAANQSSLWLAHQLTDLSNAYSMPVIKQFNGQLDINRLNNAFSALVNRHEVLRTFFVEQDGEFHQVIADEMAATVVTLEPNQETDLHTTIQTAIELDFALTELPLVRLYCIQDGGQTTLIFNVHHIISDGLSLNIMMKEFAALYHGEKLSPLEFQYADFAIAQHKWLRHPKLQSEITTLSQPLHDLPDCIALPLTSSRPQQRSSKGSTLVFEIPERLSNLVKRTAQQSQVTDFAVMLAAFFIMLNKISNQTALCVGVPFANRQVDGTENMLGLFANTLPIAAHISPEESFAEFVKSLQSRIIDCYEWQGIPLDKILNELKLKRRNSFSPLFQVMFAYQNFTNELFCLDSLQGNDLSFDIEHIKYDLKLTLIEDAGLHRAVFEYATELLDRKCIEQFSTFYIQVLENLVSSQPISKWSVLTESERKQILGRTSNSSNATAAKNVCLHQLFEQAAETKPDFPVLKYGTSTLTYALLNAKANQIANGLINHHGVENGSLIGVCTSRGFDMVVSVLAVLKAGCAYVPLDPEYPRDRISYIAQDANIEFVLTQSHLSDLFSLMDATPLIVSGEEYTQWYSNQSQQSVELSQPIKDDQLAYIIYTSGTTGKPKGVMIEHASAITMLEWAKRIYSDTELARVLASTSLCFDLSIYEIFLPLCYGYQCVIVENLIELLEKPIDVTLINSVPTVIQLVLEQGVLPKQVKVINSAGEPLSTRLVNRLLEAGVNKVCNLYGPSEDTTYSTYAEYTANISESPTIGSVIDNTQAYVLSEHQDLVPYGTAGELHLSGKGLARGYLNHPTLTAEKFINNPFYDSTNPCSSKRMYKTGDLVRYLSNGELEYIGRIDEQVKVRGYRIELQEIQTIAEAQKDVESALVLVRQNNNQKQIIAYIKPVEPITQNGQSKLDEVKAALQNKLPKYMLPDAFVTIENWPLLPNGKIDKRALPEPEFKSSTEEYVAPKSELEYQLVTLWGELLDLPEAEIGICNNFFELGGNSILVAKMLSFIAKRYLVDISFTDLFNNASIQALAQYINTGEISKLPKLINTEAQSEMVASPQQIRYFATYNIDGSTSKRMTNSFSYWKRPDVLVQAVQALVKMNDIFHTGYTFDEKKQLRITYHANPQITPLYFDTELETKDEIRQAMYSRIAQESFELSCAPLLKLLVHNTSEGGCYAVIGIFNGILDAYSGGLVNVEVERLYQLILQDKALTAPDINYRDFVRWQHAMLQSEKYNEAKAFWCSNYPKNFQSFYLPESNPDASGGTMLAFLLGEELSAQATVKAKQSESSFFNFLLANFFEIASTWYQRNDISVGLLYHGRGQAELEDKIGYFVDLLCLKVDVKANEPFETLVEKVNKNLFESIDNRIYQYQNLAERFGHELTEPKFPITAFHVNNVIVPGEEKLIPEDFVQQIAPLPYEPKFDFNIYLHESNRGIYIRMAYANRVLTTEAANRFVQDIKNTISKNSKQVNLK